MSFSHSWLDKVLVRQLKEKQIVLFIRGLWLTSDMNLLDVGCWYRRNLRLLQDVTGARMGVNTHIVEAKPEGRTTVLLC